MSALKHILLAEADKDYANLMRQAFRDAQVTNPLALVSTEQEAKDFLQTDGAARTLALVILALPMPALNNFRLLRWIRDQPELCDLPIFMLSDAPIPGEGAKAHNLGSDCYSEKPSEYEDLIRLVCLLRARWINPK